MIKKIVIIIMMLITFIGGLIVGYENTMKNIRAYQEQDGVIVLDVWGQMWVYEE